MSFVASVIILLTIKGLTFINVFKVIIVILGVATVIQVIGTFDIVAAVILVIRTLKAIEVMTPRKAVKWIIHILVNFMLLP